MSTVDGERTGATGSVARLWDWASAGSEALGFDPPDRPATPPPPIVLDADSRSGLAGLLRGTLRRRAR